MAKIMLDPGHFGSRINQSTVIPSYYESNFTWDFTLKLKSRLEAAGVEVALTRYQKDEDVAVFTRGARSKGYDLFISIHSNAAAAESPDRVVGIYQVNSHVLDFAKKSKELAGFLCPIVNKAMECVQQTQMLDYMGAGGLDYYGVLRGSAAVGTPGLILEHSFHTNYRATKWLMDDEHLEALADVECDAICEFLGVEREVYPFGDVNGDGKLDVIDYAMVKRYVLGTYELTPEQIKRADVNGDGVVDHRDYAIIKRTYLGTL